MKTLIVGCSYVENLTWQKLVNADKITLRGTSGAGNQSIAARVVYECSKVNYDNVIVLWSGVNRLDFPVGRELHSTLPRKRNNEFVYDCFTEMDDVVWYHSGGYRLSGTADHSPKFLREWLHHQYLSATPNYLSTLTLLSIIQAQTFLESKNIRYQMGFIYDVDQDYSQTKWEPGCGKLDRTSSLNRLIHWDKFIKPEPFEYTRDHGEYFDIFHPTFDTMAKWFLQHVGIDIAQ
jgi:hypothetical protein